MKMSSITKGYKAKKNVFRALSLLATFGPVIGFGIYALTQANVTERVVFSLLGVLALALGIVNILFKYSFRTAVYLMVLAVYVAIKEVTPMLIVVAICTAADEFAFEPLAKYYASKYSINKEIDKRDGSE